MDNISIGSFLRIQKQRNPEDVCRCLFGPADKDLNRRFVKEQNQLHLQVMSEKYDFDFQNEKPLFAKKDGSDIKFQWEKVTEHGQENIPEAYLLPQLTKFTIDCHIDGDDVEQDLVHSRTSPTETSEDYSEHCSIQSHPTEESINIAKSMDTHHLTFQHSTSMHSDTSSLIRTVPKLDSRKRRHDDVTHSHQAHITDYFSVKKRKCENMKRTDD